MLKTIVAISTIVTSLIVTANANATWTHFDYLGCHNYVDSWFLAEANDTDGEFGFNDIDRVRTIGEDFTLLDRVDVTTTNNIISFSIRTRFYGLSGHTSYPVMTVTVMATMETGDDDFYYHEADITILPDVIGGDTAFYPIGFVLDGGGVAQWPQPVRYRAFTVLIEVVGPMGVQHHVEQVRVNTTALSSMPEGECPH